MAPDHDAPPPPRFDHFNEPVPLWRNLMATGTVLCGAAAVITALWFVITYNEDERRAYQRRLERQIILVEICRERGGVPLFDADNFVVGCDK